MSSADLILPELPLPSVLPDSIEALEALLQRWQSVYHEAFDASYRTAVSHIQREFHEKLLEYIEQAKLDRYRQFGPSSESTNLQGRLFNEVEDVASSPTQVEEVASIPEAASAASAQPTIKRGKRGPLPAELKRIDIINAIPEAERLCSCGTLMIEIGEDERTIGYRANANSRIAAYS